MAIEITQFGKPNPDTPVIINFRTEITGETADALAKQLMLYEAIGAKDVRILISSPGGTVVRGIELHNLMIALV